MITMKVIILGSKYYYAKKQTKNAAMSSPFIKVSKSRRQILKFSFEPKNEQNYFCISALASKMGEIIKIMAHYLSDYLSSNIIICILF